MGELTEKEKIKYGEGFGGYSSKRDRDYQVRWREELEQKQAEDKRKQVKV
jgi:hypothetical protein